MEPSQHEKAAFEAGGPVKPNEIDKFVDGNANQKGIHALLKITKKNVKRFYRRMNDFRNLD